VHLDSFGFETMAGAAASSSAAAGAPLHVTGFYIVLWYALNVGYNVFNKRTCNTFPYPWTVGTLSLGAGLVYALALWGSGTRRVPSLESSDLSKLLVIAVLHSIGHFGAVISMSAGAVSFTHIVKAAEPVFSTILSGIIMGDWAPWQVNATLIPIVAGVALASAKELSFTWAAFGGAMISNLAFALRSIYMKRAMKDKEANAAKGLTTANLYAVYTIMAFVLSIPVAVAMEGADLVANWSLVTAQTPVSQLARLNFLTGIFFYLYNEFASLALGNLNAVAHAVCNTVKRVVIMVAINIAFQQSMSNQAMLGSAIAIGGTLLYALVKDMVTKRKAAKKDE